MPQKEAASSMKRPKETVCKSTDVRNPFLGFDFRRCNRLRRKLKHRCFLTLQQVSQQHHLPVRKFQRIMMSSRVVLVDLPKDGCRVIEHLALPPKQPAWATPYRSGKASSVPGRTQTAVLASSGAANPLVPGIEVLGSQFLTHFGRT